MKDEDFVGIVGRGLLPLVLEAGENCRYFAADLPACGNDNLGSAKNLYDFELHGPGEIGLGKIELRPAHDRNHVAALEILRNDPFVDSPKKRRGIDKIFGGVAGRAAACKV